MWRDSFLYSILALRSPHPSTWINLMFVCLPAAIFAPNRSHAAHIARNKSNISALERDTLKKRVEPRKASDAHIMWLMWEVKFKARLIFETGKKWHKKRFAHSETDKLTRANLLCAYIFGFVSFQFVHIRGIITRFITMPFFASRIAGRFAEARTC